VATLDDFNDEPADRAVQALRACNAAPRFAAEVVAGRPYRDVETLVGRAEEAARALPWDDVAVALATHPRIGDRVEGSSAEAESSRREQSSMADADAATRDALLEGNRAYEERFDRVFLIRAAGRTPAEMLAELRRRLDNDEETERAEVTEQLAQITGLRVRELLGATATGERASQRAPASEERNESGAEPVN
jgi:2-oxo-4-hydroxy-4-carboxy-5-ureidoimidazoline decarboxylase